MADEVIYRPNRPVGEDGITRGPDADSGGTYYFLVTQGHKIVAAYHLFYFRTPGEVLVDLLDMAKAGRLDGWFEDFAVWWSDRLQVAIHQPMDEEHQRIVWFGEERNAPGQAGPLSWWSGWPSYDQWVADGKGDIEFSLEKYPASW